MSEKNSQLPEQRAYREQYEAFFAPLGRKIANRGISANFISYLNLVFSIFTTIAFIYSNGGHYLFIYLAIIFLAIASFFDMIDGSVARAHVELNPNSSESESKFGAVLDPAIDRYSEAFIVLGLMLSGYVPPELVFITFVGMMMASYVRARAESISTTSGSFSVGIERKEKITLIAIGALLEALFLQFTQLNIYNFSDFYFPYQSVFGSFSIGPLAIFVLIVGLLSHLSTFQRLKLASKYL